MAKQNFAKTAGFRSAGHIYKSNKLNWLLHTLNWQIWFGKLKDSVKFAAWNGITQNASVVE